jgi:hypothetical protein
MLIQQFNYSIVEVLKVIEVSTALFDCISVDPEGLEIYIDLVCSVGFIFVLARQRLFQLLYV